MPLSDIVNVQISRQTQAVSEAGFGTLMILGTHKRFNDKIRFYSSLADVAEDFEQTDAEYIAAQDVFSQSITPDRIAIGRRTVDNATIEVETAQEDFTYTTTINGVNVSISSTSDAQYSTVTFSSDFVASNTINLQVNGSAIAPVVYSTDHLTTMTNLAAAIATNPDVDTVDVTGTGANLNRVLIVNAKPNKDGLISNVVVSGGVTQPTATIVDAIQPTSSLTISDAMVAEINNSPVNTVVLATDNHDGTYSVSALSAGTPYTLSVSTNIINPINARVTITQVEPGQQYQLLANGNEYLYDAPNEVQSNEQIAAYFVTAINESSAETNIEATDNADGSFEIASTGPMILQVSEGLMTVSKGLIIEPLAPSETVVTDLTAIQAIDDSWYALACTDRAKATVQAIAAWIEGREKIFGTASSDDNIINQAYGVDTTSIAALLNASGYVRSFVIYHQDADHDYPECAWFGNCLPLVPGSETWKFKRLNGISYSDLSTTQSLNARNKKCNTYEYMGGSGVTREGTMAQGEYIDIIRGVDWLKSAIQTYVYQTMINAPKIPYTDAGITAIEAQVRRAIREGQDNEFIAADPAPVITVPRSVDVPAVDKANRILRNVKFQATLAGAIHAVTVNGVVSV